MRNWVLQKTVVSLDRWSRHLVISIVSFLKSIFVNAKILILSYNISNFALTKIVLEQRYLEMIAPLGYPIHHYSSLSNDLQNISYISTLGKACFSFSCFSFIVFVQRVSVCQKEQYRYGCRIILNQVNDPMPMSNNQFTYFHVQTPIYFQTSK